MFTWKISEKPYYYCTIHTHALYTAQTSGRICHFIYTMGSHGIIDPVLLFVARSLGILDPAHVFATTSGGIMNPATIFLPWYPAGYKIVHMKFCRGIHKHPFLIPSLIPPCGDSGRRIGPGPDVAKTRSFRFVADDKLGGRVTQPVGPNRVYGESAW